MVEEPVSQNRDRDRLGMHEDIFQKFSEKRTDKYETWSFRLQPTSIVGIYDIIKNI